VQAADNLPKREPRSGGMGREGEGRQRWEVKRV